MIDSSCSGSGGLMMDAFGFPCARRKGLFCLADVLSTVFLSVSGFFGAILEFCYSTSREQNVVPSL